MEMNFYVITTLNIGPWDCTVVVHPVVFSTYEEAESEVGKLLLCGKGTKYKISEVYLGS